jgi:hypothetical protein
MVDRSTLRLPSRWPVFVVLQHRLIAPPGNGGARSGLQLDRYHRVFATVMLIAYKEKPRRALPTGAYKVNEMRSFN